MMFAVIYRGFLKPGKENEYKAAWKTIAKYFIDNRGAIGSTLHKAEDGMYLAYSKWPDKKTRDASWGNTVGDNFPGEIKRAVATLKNCLDPDRELPEIQLELIDEFSSE